MTRTSERKGYVVRKYSAPLLLLLAISQAALAQGQSEGSKPATKLEAFQAKSGVVLVRGFTTIGSLHGQGGTITVDARDFRDAGNSKTRISGVSISVQESGRLERENTAFIDSDEIPSLLAGLDYIAKATKDVTPLALFEVEYRTKGDFGVAVFNNVKGEVSVAVSAGRIGKTSAYITLQRLPELRQMIQDARSKL